MSRPWSYKNFLSAISSPVSAVGPTPCDSQVGPTINPSGPEVVLANLSATQARAAGLLTSGTFGPLGSISSASASLQQFLASKLQVKMHSLGSILFTLTWKERSTPSGLRICALRASVLRISGNDCTSWPTPSSSNGDKSVRTLEGAESEAARKGWNNDLCTAAIGSWPTPTVNDSLRQPNPETKTPNVTLNHAAGWATPRTSDTNGPGLHGDGDGGADLRTQASWATPAARDWKDGRASQKTMDRCSRPLNEQAVNLAAWSTPRANKWGFPDAHGSQESPLGMTSDGSCVEMEKPGQLNPALSRWLQGYPEEWDRAAILAWRSMPTTRRKREKCD